MRCTECPNQLLQPCPAVLGSVQSGKTVTRRIGHSEHLGDVSGGVRIHLEEHLQGVHKEAHADCRGRCRSPHAAGPSMALLMNEPFMFEVVR